MTRIIRTAKVRDLDRMFRVKTWEEISDLRMVRVVTDLRMVTDLKAIMDLRVVMVRIRDLWVRILVRWVRDLRVDILRILVKVRWVRDLKTSTDTIKITDIGSKI